MVSRKTKSLCEILSRQFTSLVTTSLHLNASTNRFNFKVRLFSNWSQPREVSVCDCVTDVLTTFLRLLWSISEQTHGTNKETKKYVYDVISTSVLLTESSRTSNDRNFRFGNWIERESESEMQVFSPDFIFLLVLVHAWENEKKTIPCSPGESWFQFFFCGLLFSSHRNKSILSAIMEILSPSTRTNDCGGEKENSIIGVWQRGII